MQGARWRRLDNTAKIFPGITNEDLSNVFRVSMVLKEEVDPELLEEALERVLPALEAFASSCAADSSGTILRPTGGRRRWSGRRSVPAATSTAQPPAVSVPGELF